jgi:CO/xanthine dehydrogenase Mo-binding subunit/CO/xanthine dehydrogenase FAD-binding subunit
MTAADGDHGATKRCSDMRDEATVLPTAGQIGQRVWALDWEARTTGGAGYVGDILPDGTLFGAVLRSPHPHAAIESIDVSEAQRMRGVRAVITARHFAKGARYAAYNNFDRPPLADDVVRFIGQEVAAVAADTREQARAAAAAIRVRYRRLKAPLSVAAALARGAPLLHAPPAPVPAAAGTAPASAAKPVVQGARNVRHTLRVAWGDLDKGRNADVVVSGCFEFPQQNHCCMETQHTLAEWTEDGRLHVWSATGTPLALKRHLMALLDLPSERVVVHEVAVGGSFGSKIQINGHEALAVRLAQEARRPVLIALSREEEFETNYTRHAFKVDLALSGDVDGRMRRLDGKVTIDNGAYIGAGRTVMAASMTVLGAAYNLDAVAVDAQLVDTCKVPGGAMRGYGGPQTTLARESLIDELAERLGRDPIELRLQNAYGSHVQSLIGHIGTNGTANCLIAVRDAIGWTEEKEHPRHGRGRGVGVALGEHPSGAYTFPDSNRAEAFIDLTPDGRFRVRCGCSDVGTGQRTMLAQIAAHELGVRPQQVDVLTMDTDQTPLEWGGWGSRGTHYTGHSVGRAARNFTARLKAIAARELGNGPIQLEGGYAHGDRGSLPLGDLVGLSGEAEEGMLTHFESYVQDDVERIKPDGSGDWTATHNYAVHAAVVEVDDKTGKVLVADYVSASDSGTVMNPINLEGQIAGATVIGLGGALGEEMIFEQGKVVNPAFLHYAVPRAADVPKIRIVHAGLPDERGPYGAKGTGELGVNPVGAALANAIYDAVGARLRSAPFTPDKVLTALAAKAGRKRNFRLWRRPMVLYVEMVRRAYPLGLFKVLHWLRIRNYRVPPPVAPLQSVGKPTSLAELVADLGPDARPCGGGTDVQLCRRQHLYAPKRLVSVSRVTEMQGVTVQAGGDISIGAAVKLSELANALRTKLPVIAETIDEIASPQVRNAATVAGSLGQWKRCWFFRNGFQCYKRTGLSTAPCYAIQGDHRFYHAVIDGHRCQAVTPSDLATTFTALDASVAIFGPSGERIIPATELYTGPGETCLSVNEVITRIVIPEQAVRRRTHFKKLNLWQGDFAIASAAVSIALDEEGRCQDARIVLGAVAPVPFRATRSEKRLQGRMLSPEVLRSVLDEELDSRAHPLARNAWKLDAVAGLAERALEQILEQR